MKKIPNPVKTLIMITLLLAPLTDAKVRTALEFMYKNIINGQIFTGIDIYSTAFKVNAILLAITTFAILLLAAITRTVSDIDTRIKKTLFVAGLLLYLLPTQVATLVICADIAGKHDEIPWNVFLSTISLSYFATLAMSLWTYRILVCRKSPMLKVWLATAANLMLVAAAVAPYIGNFNPLKTYAALALTAVWLATAADISFSGFGYKAVEKLLAKKGDK